MTMSSITTVTIRQVELTLDQLVADVRQLETDARSEIAKVQMETELDGRMSELIKSLASRPPADDVSDADIVSEVNAVREQRHQW